MYISVTGYFGVGSSAVLDLLTEYSSNGTGIKDPRGGYEHTTFYTPGGLFDLEDKLLLANDLHRSDEALDTFEKEMRKLNKYNFGWYGSFKKMFGNAFENNLNEFVESLHPITTKTRYYGQCKKVIFNPFKIPLQLAAKVLLGRTIYKWGRQFVWNSIKPKTRVAFPSEDEFFANAKKFVRNYMEMYREPGKRNVILDRLLVSQNLYRIPNYFDDDFRIIRVKRDVRDLFFLNRDIWEKINAGSMYPKDYEEFVDYWRRVKQNEKNIEDCRILTIFFEDLVYKYDETVAKIEEFCGLEPSEHVNAGMFLKPEASKKNTQVFKMDNSWKEIANKLSKTFPEDIYEFPYEIETDIKYMFDDSRA